MTSTAKYRLVYFIPDPFSGGRVPVAALIGDGQHVSVARASHIPGPACLGFGAPEATMQLVLDSLGGARAFDALPASVGPHAILGPPIDVPLGVGNPDSWVVNYVLPRPRDQKSRQYKKPKRQTEGYQFFEQWDVTKYVRKRFQPEEEWAEALPRPTSPLSPISHWVGSPHVGISLMEPIRPARLQIDSEIHEIYNRLAGYRVFLQNTAQSKIRENTSLCVYILPGGKDEVREKIPAAFKDLGAKVVDTAVDPQRTDFLALIRDLGHAAERQAAL